MSKEQFFVLDRKTLNKYFLEILKPEIESKEFKKTRYKNSLGVSVSEHFGLYLTSLVFTFREGRTFVPGFLASSIGKNSKGKKEFDDGAIVDLENEVSTEVEQTYVYEGKWDGNPVGGIVDRIDDKSKIEYSLNTWLIIHCNSAGNFNPDWIRDSVLNSRFLNIFIFGPNGKKGKYCYNFQILKQFGIISNTIYEVQINELTGESVIKKL